MSNQLLKTLLGWARIFHKMQSPDGKQICDEFREALNQAHAKNHKNQAALEELAELAGLALQAVDRDDYEVVKGLTAQIKTKYLNGGRNDV